MILIIWLGKIIQTLLRFSGHGSGGTWPGHILLKIYPQFLSQSLSQLTEGIILVTGTNGKTTTTALITHLLRSQQKRVISNETGANLLNGIASSVISLFDLTGRPQFQLGVFEIDENVLPLILKQITPRQIIFLNLFRDQLDRYGEVDTIADRWETALSSLKDTTLILNADDPAIATLGLKTNLNSHYFGLDVEGESVSEYRHVHDSSYCRICGGKLTYTHHYFSHLGVWSCQGCGLASPPLDSAVDTAGLGLKGDYNQYNLKSAWLSLSLLGNDDATIRTALSDFVPVFGRFEEIEWQGLKVILGLAKNPTGFNEALKTMRDLSLSRDCLLLALNDRIPDGRDISWIWDVDFEELLKGWPKVIVTGTRALDLALRVEYAGVKLGSTLFVFEQYLEAFDYVQKDFKGASPLPVLATYSAMTEIRKLLKGRALL